MDSVWSQQVAGPHAGYVRGSIPLKVYDTPSMQCNPVFMVLLAKTADPGLSVNEMAQTWCFGAHVQTEQLKINKKPKKCTCSSYSCLHLREFQEVSQRQHDLKLWMDDNLTTKNPDWRITFGNSLGSKAHLTIALWAFGGSQHINFGNTTSMVTSTGVFAAWHYGIEFMRLQRLLEKQLEIKTEMQLWPDLLGDIGAEEGWVHGKTNHSPQLPHYITF